MNKSWNGWMNVPPILRVVSLKLFDLIEFTSPNPKWYFNLFRAVAYGDVIVVCRYQWELIELTCKYSVHHGTSREKYVTYLTF